mmetsp:Transcript_26476/g.63031  ORF Transcript_26476/g.63031 Transcript_26476/m.63031 type:complete len:1075 (-) Transcript_26476:59-3283(-)
MNHHHHHKTAMVEVYHGGDNDASTRTSSERVTATNTGIPLDGRQKQQQEEEVVGQQGQCQDTLFVPNDKSVRAMEIISRWSKRERSYCPSVEDGVEDIEIGGTLTVTTTNQSPTLSDEDDDGEDSIQETTQDNALTEYRHPQQQLRQQQTQTDSFWTDSNDDHLDDSDMNIDPDEFLEYAREVIAENDLSYDSASFRDFEKLLEQHIRNHFLDDDSDQDSLVSMESFSGYTNEGGKRRIQKKTFRQKQIISEQAYHRMVSMIARPKNKNRPGERKTSENSPSAVVSSPRCMYKVDDSDDSTAATSTGSVRSLKRSRNSADNRLDPNQNLEYNYDPNSSIIDSDDDDSSSNFVPRPRPPRRRFLANAASKKLCRSQLPPVAPPRKRSRSSPTTSTADRNSPPAARSASNATLKDVTVNMNQQRLSTDNKNENGGGGPRITELFPSPTQKEKVLDYLKSRAPSLHESVVARLQTESTVVGNVQRTPVKSAPAGKFLASSPSLTSPESTGTQHQQQHQVNIEVVLSDNKLAKQRQDQVIIQESTIEYSSLLRPSKIRGMNSSDKSLPETDRVNTINSALQEMKLKIQKSKAINEVLVTVAGRESGGTVETTEDLSRRGMALIHKFRSRRKAALQAEYLQKTGQTNSEIVVSRSQSSPSGNDPTSNPQICDTPEDLEAYLKGNVSNFTSTGSSPLEEKKRRLRFLKEKRRRAMIREQRNTESRESLLWEAQSFPSGQENTSGPTLSIISSTGDTSPANRNKTSSPFKGKVFSRTRQPESSYEVLDESPDRSPAHAEITAMSTPSTLTVSSNGSKSFERKNKLKMASLDDDLESDDIRQIIAPQSPDRALSPIRGYRVSVDISFSSPHPNIPTIFEDENSIDEDCVQLVPSASKSSSDPWNSSDLSFQSNSKLFPESSKAFFLRKKQQKSSLLHLETTCDDNQLEQFPSNTTAKSLFGDDPFDEIVFRQTPSHKLSGAVDPFVDDSSSPTGVVDLFESQCRISSPKALQSSRPNYKFYDSRKYGGGGKPIDLGFVDEEEERDLVFVDDCDNSSDSLPSDAESGCVSVEPVFLSVRMFEI